INNAAKNLSMCLKPHEKLTFYAKHDEGDYFRIGLKINEYVLVQHSSHIYNKSMETEVIHNCYVKFIELMMGNYFTNEYIKPREYEVWTEGYSATGEHGTASFEGKILAKNFDEACVKILGERLDKDDKQEDGYRR